MTKAANLAASANATAGNVTATAIQSNAASTPPLFQDSAGTQIGTLCRAWVNFTGSTAVIRASFNVSSVTRNNTGDYTVNITNALPDANYMIAGTGSGATTNMLPVTPADTTTARTASAFRFVILASNGGTAVDCAQTSVAVFR